MLTLRSVMLGTDDPKALVAFYTKVLGEPGWQDEAFSGWDLGGPYLMVGAHSDVKGRSDMPGRVIINLETTDVAGEFARIKETGAPVVHELYNPGGPEDFRMATFEDPDGNYFQIASPMPDM